VEDERLLTVWQAALLGVIQGLTEFLPVSSDGHLVIAQEGFGLRPPHAIAFDVLLHLGTLLAVLGYFRRDLIEMTRALFGARGEEMDVRRRWIWLLGLGTAPVALVGFLFKDWFEQTFHSMAWAGGGLLLTGTLLWLVHGKGATGRTASGLTLMDAMMIGGIQSIALLPGVSRSGSTLFCALSIGVERTTAARFSFLLSIPAIAGALVLNLSEVLEMAADGNVLPLVVGPLAAAATGLLAIEVLMRAVARGSLRGFSVYCWIVGTLTLAWSVWSGVGSQVG
jgi:undecaprenyl-diphosphatase